MKLFATPILVFICACILSACATDSTVHSMTVIQPSNANHKPKVLVVNTDDSIHRYHLAQQNFLQTMHSQSAITKVNLQHESNPTELLQDVLNQHKYAIIYCLGAKALGSINYLAPNSPVVFSSVLSWRQFSHIPGFYGVASDIPPKVQLTWFKHFFPSIKRIGVLYSHANSALISTAKKDAIDLGITLSASEIRNSDQIKTKLSRIAPKVDAIWLISDPVVMDSIQHIKQIMKISDEFKKPLLGHNEALGKMGATLVISADLPTVGRQAAIITQKLMDGTAEKPLIQSIQYPAGSHILLNLKRVKRYQLKLNDAALDAVSELITQ